MPNVIDRYETRLAERGYTADSAQRAAIERLQKLADELADFDNRPGGLLKRLMSRGKVPPRGVWMYGGVGRGARVSVCRREGAEWRICSILRLGGGWRSRGWPGRGEAGVPGRCLRA